MIYGSILKSSMYLGSYPVINKVVKEKKKLTILPHQHHPELEKLYFINNLTNERINPNGPTINIDNDFFTGKMLIMVRTSDADKKIEAIDNTIGEGSTFNDKVSNYLRRDKKRFEIQLQMKFKKPSESQTYLSVGYDEPVNLKPLQRTFLEAALRFCRMRNPTFSYSLSGKEKVSEEDKQQGKYEDPHFAFPIETSFDRITITKAGDKPPTLGSHVHEDPVAIANRMNGERIVFNTEDTYTLYIWNENVDFIRWRAMNLPAIRSFSLANVNAGQPMKVKVYSLSTNDGKHLKSDMETLLDVEVTHTNVTSIGIGTKKWMKQCADKIEKSSYKEKSAPKKSSKSDFADEESIIYGLLGFIFLS